MPECLEQDAPLWWRFQSPRKRSIDLKEVEENQCRGKRQSGDFQLTLSTTRCGSETQERRRRSEGISRCLSNFENEVSDADMQMLEEKLNGT